MLGPILLMAVAAASATKYADPVLSYGPDEFYIMKRLQIHPDDTRRDDDNKEVNNYGPTIILCPENPSEECDPKFYDDCIRVRNPSGGNFLIKECPCGAYPNNKNSTCWDTKICYARPGEFCSYISDDKRKQLIDSGKEPDVYSDIRCPGPSKCLNQSCTDPGTQICRKREKKYIRTQPRLRQNREYLRRGVSSLVDFLQNHCLFIDKYNTYEYGKPRSYAL